MPPSNAAVVLAALTFLGTAGLIVLAVAAGLWALGRGRPALARRLGLGAAALVGCYLLVLLLAGALSHDTVLAPGDEKYFCELDCHLAYSIVGVRELAGAAAGTRRVAVTVRTRFDEKTISPRRPREAPTWPNPRRVALLDTDGRGYAPAGEGEGSVPITRELRPGESYETVLLFDLPGAARPARLLLESGDPIDRLLIGQEPSPLHGRTLLALP